MGLNRQVAGDDRVNVLHRYIIDDEGAGAAGVAVDQREYLHLVAEADLDGLLAGTGALIDADESFIDFDDAASAAERDHAGGAHGLADTMRHEPSGLEGDAQGA